MLDFPRGVTHGYLHCNKCNEYKTTSQDDMKLHWITCSKTVKQVLESYIPLGIEVKRLTNEIEHCPTEIAKQELRHKQFQLIILRGEIEHLLYCCINDEYEKIVLRARFIDGMGYDQIADLVGYERSWVCRISQRAIERINDKCNSLRG